MQTHRKPLEKQVKNAILGYLRARNLYALAVQPGRGADAGTPDIIACIGGRFVAIECKRDLSSSKTTPLQKQTLFEIQLCGGVAVVARSLDEFLALMREHNVAI